MYSIEATFDLNWLRIVHVDSQRIRLDRIKDRGPHPGKQDTKPRADAEHDHHIVKDVTHSSSSGSSPQRLPSLYNLMAGTALIGPTNLPNSTPAQLSLIRRASAKDYNNLAT